MKARPEICKICLYDLRVTPTQMSLVPWFQFDVQQIHNVNNVVVSSKLHAQDFRELKHQC